MNALIALILSIASIFGHAAQSASPAEPAAKATPTKHGPAVIQTKPVVTAKPARFTAPHVVSARVIDGYFWVVTDLPNAASSIASAKSICHSAVSHLRFSNTRVAGISVRAKGDSGRLVLVAGRAC